MQNGNITLNGVSEKQVSKIFEFKLAHEGQFSYNPAAMTQFQPQQSTPAIYNGVLIQWNNDDQFKVVLQLLSSLVSG